MSQSIKEQFEGSAVFFSGNSDFLEQAYEAYLRGEAIDPLWQAQFDAMQSDMGADVSHEGVKKAVLRSVNAPKIEARSATQATTTAGDSRWQVLAWVEAYRRHGHRAAALDPLGITPPEDLPVLAPEQYQLTMDQQVDGRIVGLGESVSVAQMAQALQWQYTSGVGLEYLHIECDEQRAWLSAFMQDPEQRGLSKDQAKTVLKDLASAEGMEQFLANRFVGQKRFSLEGCESLVPLLNQLIALSVNNGVEEVTMGMAHRGRLNVMLNILGMTSKQLCDRFSGKDVSVETSGDVKYHLGLTADRQIEDKTVHLSLGFNPSHLEFIVPVVMGTARAKLDHYWQGDTSKVLPIAIHGDAALAGQGVVAEWFNMAHVKAHDVGGGIHIIANNQIGFTTEHSDSRSSRYSSDLVKRCNMPILHVNADDLASVVFCARLAAAYRKQFKRSIMIDLVGYRRLGHNEADDPSLTQPLMYDVIKKQPTTHTLWGQKCVADYGMSEADVKQIRDQVHQKLSNGEALVDVQPPSKALKARSERWVPYKGHSDQLLTVNTQVDEKVLHASIKGLVTYPSDFQPHRQVAKIIQSYQAVLDDKGRVQWGLAESLAYASLLQEGFNIRMVGQDIQRGTFSHRHVVWHDCKTGKEHAVLAQWSGPGHRVDTYNSVLSELAVVGFEYGYATCDPKNLVIWEAQFGDFANGAQVIFDQFISSGWQKWQRMCGLVVLLPHGYEGQGPEHSSARMERFLQLCAQENMRVCVPSTPAQMFHLLRMQMHSPVRRPLIVITPKSLLRNPEATNTLDELAKGSFEYVLPEIEKQKKGDVKRVIVCSGKVYYDLLAHRATLKKSNVALVRIEQLYPFPKEALTKALKGYTGMRELLWCQEEPRNQGAWHTIRHCLEDVTPKGVKLSCVSRDALASPAAGYVELHKARQNKLIEEAFA